MMQSAVALAASNQATKTLGEANAKQDRQDRIEGDDGGVPRLPGRSR
jgi:hypothetical protein